MPKYSKISKDRLMDAHPDLQVLFNIIIKYFDCSIVCSHRTKEYQDNAYENGYSKLKWPKSKHNKLPSLAVDVIPYPSKYTDRDKQIEFGGFVMGVAAILKEQGIIENEIEWGWNIWNWDLPHFEIKT